MAQIKNGSAKVTIREIDASAVAPAGPSGVPAGVIGTSNRGPAFVPLTVASIEHFKSIYGDIDGLKFGPIAAQEWLRNARALTYVRTLGVGKGLKREALDGSVDGAGFTVGEEQPAEGSWGIIQKNPYAYDNGPAGRTYFLGTLMSASSGVGFSEYNDLGVLSIQNSSKAVPLLRGVLMAPSGVVLTLSSCLNKSDLPSNNVFSPSGSAAGDVNLNQSSQFVMLLNGHKGSSTFPNVITASFSDVSQGYFVKSFNTDPYKMQEAGHYLYANWGLPSFVVTGSGLLSSSYGQFERNGLELAAFLLTGSASRDAGNATTPNYEAFTDRYRHAVTPWVISQKFGGKNQNLFRLHALDDGEEFSRKYKFSIQSIVPSSDKSYPYGAFDLVIRAWDDTDTSQVILERFTGLSLDPSSDNYVARKIGNLNMYYDFDRNVPDQKLVYEGDYENNSKYVRIEMNPVLEAGEIDPTALPVGFRGIYHTVTSGSSPLATLGDLPVTGSASPSFTQLINQFREPPLPFRLSIDSGNELSRVVDSKLYWGVAFQNPKLKKGYGYQLNDVLNTSLKSYSKYFPDFKTNSLNFVVGNNEGVPDTVQNGVLDADRFNDNLFSLENITVYTSSLGSADSQRWAEARYMRNGSVYTGEKTRNWDPSKDLAETFNRQFAKFTFFSQGGFDGVNIFDKDEKEINNYAVESDMKSPVRGNSEGPNVRAYIKALEVMKNVVNVDIQLLAIPGIRNEFISDLAIKATEERFDALYLMDIWSYDAGGQPITSSVQKVDVKETSRNFIERNLNTSFAAAYFPDVSVRIPSPIPGGPERKVIVPATSVALGAMSLNDSLGQPWFAPAGVNRGMLSTALEPEVNMQQINLDTLYDANINPIIQKSSTAPGLSPNGEVIVWGQKTLLATASSLDRINVRRLLIEIRRQVRDIARTILFEPNRAATLAKFSAAITPVLTRIQSLSGLDRFKVIVDSSTTTQLDVENNTIRGKIYVQPTKTLEYISLDFNVSNTL